MRITFLNTYSEILPTHLEGEVLRYKAGEPVGGEVEKVIVPLIELFKSFTVKDGWGEESDWRGDILYTLEDEEENAHWLKADIQKELDFFLQEALQNYSTWQCWTEDEYFGDTLTTDYYKVEEKLIEICNFKQITPRLFWDEENKIGYYIEEYASFASPEYNIWFFEK